MPHGSATLEGSATRVRKDLSVSADRGFIVNASAQQLPATSSPKLTWAEIWLMVADPTRDSRVALLTQGYITNSGAIGWSGRIPLETGMFIELTIRQSSLSTIRLTFSTELEV